VKYLVPFCLLTFYFLLTLASGAVLRHPVESGNFWNTQLLLSNLISLMVEQICVKLDLKVLLMLAVLICIGGGRSFKVGQREKSI